MREWSQANQQWQIPGHIASGRGKETLFRSTFRNQINHIAIADNKANMIININSIIISLIIAVLVEHAADGVLPDRLSRLGERAG